jgi:DNA polymerase-3 subunit gamma/tau
VCDSCREIRAGNSVDVIEIDAATNRGIDEIRELREGARYRPARDRFKIYILDEAHQITDAAFNALLKTLEEPPSHIVFMMATTQPEDIPQTIRSRCQHFSFHAVKFEDILAQLKMIAGLEEVEAEEGALALLAEAGDGSMRDALSIMDQAIASAPLEDGRPVLAATQIRELMGSVPNAIFERLLEAVAAGQSAELMEQLNVLLNAGHSPSSLARQMVRYLRNSLMAKIGGEQTELLQISSDERARAARTAMLFGEEELTRNLQIVLRTFDDLNYRQEQRFHLELGLLKLIHAQRLLPIEELLSGAAGSGGARGVTPSAPPRTTPSSPRASAAPTHAPAPAPASKPTAPPAISPFGASTSSWAPETTAKPEVPAAPVALEAPPVIETRSMSPAAPANGSGGLNGAAYATVELAASVEEPAAVPEAEAMPVKSTEPAVSAGSIDTAAMRTAVSAALTTAGHASAAQLLGSGEWTIDGNNLRIEVALMSKKMLALTVNAAAEKIVKQELQRLGGPARFLVVPGAGGGMSSAPSSAPLSGSVEEAALANPLVQRAREIFHAEVRSVVDLRQK